MKHLTWTQRTLMVVAPSLLPLKGAEVVHYYDFESGYEDLAGEADGAVGNEVTTSSGFDGGQAASFPGSLTSGDPFDERGVVGIDPPITEIDGEFSFSYWVKLAEDVAADEPRGIFDFSGDGEDGPQSLYIQRGPNANRLAFRVDGAGDGNAVAFVEVPEDDTWFFISATFSPGNELRVYLNGQLATTVDASSVIDVAWNPSQYLGAFNVNGVAAARGLDGSLDDFAIYSGLLTPGEIADLFDSTLSPSDFGLATGEFLVTGFETSGDTASLTFSTRTNRGYRIFGGADLSAPEGWTEFTTSPLPGTGGPITAPLSLGDDAPELFFQVREFPITP